MNESSTIKFMSRIIALFTIYTSMIHIESVSGFSPRIAPARTFDTITCRHMTRDDPPLTVFLEKLSKTGIDNKSIRVNSLVVTKYDIPDLGIFADQTYELQSIYLQGERQSGNEVLDNESDSKQQGVIEKIELKELDLESGSSNLAEKGRAGYTLYIKLFNPVYHDDGQAVIVTPEEVGLVSMKDEVLDSVLMALPILSFWLGTCFVFANTYNQRYGGNFFDALLGK